MRQLVLCALAAGMIAGCGGGGGSASSSGGGDEYGAEGGGGGEGTVGETGGEEGGGGGEEATPSGPGQLRVVNQIGGQEAHGTVRVLSMSGDVVAEGRSGETFTVPSGTYNLTGSITDEDELIDKPTRESDSPVTVVAGQEVTGTIAFPVSRVRIRVTRRGRAVARWRMEVRPVADESAEPIELRSGNEHVPITPGRYRAVLHFGNEQITVDEVIFQGGATMDVPVNVN